jgi:hypothetical protein
MALKPAEHAKAKGKSTKAEDSLACLQLAPIAAAQAK